MFPPGVSVQPDQFSRETLQDLRMYTCAREAVARIREIYAASVALVRRTMGGACAEGAGDHALPEVATYPWVGVDIPHERLNVDGRLAYGLATEPGEYGITLTRPDLFCDYYADQIDRIIRHHEVPVYVGISPCRIPFPFVAGSVLREEEERVCAWLEEGGSGALLPDLRVIDDRIANGEGGVPGGEAPMPLALFTAERVDFSLSRLHHYTGTSVEHFQRFVLLTNYQRYVPEFIDFARRKLEEDSGYSALVEPGDVVTLARSGGEVHGPRGRPVSHMPQMPAWHLRRPDGDGITLINIGVGPSNARTITDHLAVLRPHCWLMLGHCAGLRRSQALGDYVLAHGYVREDHVLDEDLPLWVPVPPIAEVQVALQEALERVLHLHGHDVRSCMRTGTVVTTANRNWELRLRDTSERYCKSRAIAVDMESATVAANGFRFRVPYGTLLCVSDKPVHGELKLPQTADSFYRRRVSQHLQVGLETMTLLRQKGVDQLHSRKLRGFNEPLFR